MLKDGGTAAMTSFALVIKLPVIHTSLSRLSVPRMISSVSAIILIMAVMTAAPESVQAGAVRWDRLAAAGIHRMLKTSPIHQSF